MREKIGKRIGPVPIALVAVLALAAFISAGLWLAPNDQSAQAQGLPETTSPPTADGGDKCGVVVFDGTDLTQDRQITGPKCNVSDDSVDVVFENTNEVSSNVSVAGVATNGEVSMVVYTTGGGDFPSVQALVPEDDPDESDGDGLVADAAGEVGVDEHLIKIGRQTGAFGSTTPGSQTITVSRSMAGDDGKVYLFGYYGGDEGNNPPAAQQFLIEGKFDVNRDGDIDGDDDRTGDTVGDVADIVTAEIIEGAIDVNNDDAITAADTYDDGSGTMFVIRGGVIYPIEMPANGSSPVNIGAGIRLINGKADVNGDGTITEADDREAVTTDDVDSNDDLATVAIIDGAFDLTNQDTDVANALEVATGDYDDDTGTSFVIREGVIRPIGNAVNGPASGVGVDLGLSPDTFGDPAVSTPGGTTDNSDDFVRDSVYHVPFASGIQTYFPRVFTDASGNPTSTGVAADIVVVVRFQDPPSDAKDSAGEPLSSVKGTPVSSSGTSTVTVTIKDENGVGLSGFASLVIAEDAGDKVVFSDSNLKSHRIEIKNGTGPAAIKGLPKTGAVRVKVTATFGDFEVSGNVTRSGRAASLDVKTYSCVTRVGNLGVPPSRTCRIEAGTKADALTEATSFAPGEMFLVVGTLKDAEGNTLDKRLSARQLQPSGTTKAISLLENVAAASKMDATSDSLEYPAVTSVHANTRMYATVDTNEANAQLGSYDIEVSGDGQKMTATVTIAGEVSQISVDGPEMIPTASGVGTFTVKATDANGNVPTNVGDDEGDFKALVSVRPTTSQVLGTDDGKFEFNAKTGEATFFVQVADDAEVGDSLTITVTAIGDSSIAPVTMTVTYGGPSTDPGTMDELAAPTGVVVSVLQDTISVTWTKDPNAEQTKVVVYNADVTSIEYIETVNAANDDGGHTFTDVASGTYKVTVASFRTGESHKLSTPLQTVTIE